MFLALCMFFGNSEAGVPAWIELGGMYDTEPMLVFSDPYINYVHGLEGNLRMGSGLGKDVSTWTERDHWSLFVDVQQYMDTGDLGATMGVVQPPQEIFNPAGFYLGELSLTREAGDGRWYIHLGSMSADMDFVAPEATGLYVHSAFNNQYNISMAQFPISPFNSLGAAVGLTLSDTLQLKSGVYQLSRMRTDESIRGWQWELSPDNGLLGFMQLDGTFDSNEESALPTTGWEVGTFLSRDEASMDRVSNHGVYGNVTFPVRDHSVGWVSVNQGLNPSVNPVPLWVAGGWISDVSLLDRAQDLLVTGLSWSQYSFDSLDNREVMVEIEYHYAAADWLTLLPNVQYFLDTPSPNGVFPVTMGVGVVAEY